MAKSDILFMTKPAKKLHPLALHIPIYSPYKGVPPGGLALLLALLGMVH